MIQLVKDVNPLNVYARPPTQTEFELIQKLYKLESQGTPEEKANYLEMSKTDVHANYFMHQQAQNQNGQIFAGYLIDKAI